MPVNRRFHYAIVDSNSKPLEIGIGYLSDANTFVRERPHATYIGSVYDNTAPTAVTLAAGTKYLIGTAGPGALSTVMPDIINATVDARILMPSNTYNGQQSNAGPNTTIRGYFFPVHYEFYGLVDAFLIRASATVSLDLALYTMRGNGSPGDVVCSAVNSSVVAGTNMVTFTPALIVPGWYYLYFNASNSSTLYYYLSFLFNNLGNRGTVYFPMNTSALAITQAQGTLPADPSTAGVGLWSDTSSNLMPAIGLRVA